MRIILSRRVEAELADHFAFGVARHGSRVAERTFQRVRKFLFQSLPAHPQFSFYRADRGVYERFIPRTPFVVFYRVNLGCRHLPSRAGSGSVLGLSDAGIR
jgi:hypothetical protein